MTNESNKKELYAYVLSINGVYGRNRSVKFKTVRIATAERDKPLTVEQLLPAVRTALADLKVKPGAHVSLSQDPIEVTTYAEANGKTVMIETYLISLNKSQIFWKSTT